jgi:hypothetical protein
VAGRTRLYQRAGSPLIHGRSRFERPGWVDWVVAYAISVVALYAAHAISTLLDPTRTSLNSPTALLQWVASPAPGVVGALPGAALGVWLARTLGSRGAWLVGAVCGTLLGVLAMLAWRRFV